MKKIYIKKEAKNHPSPQMKWCNVQKPSDYTQTQTQTQNKRTHLDSLGKFSKVAQ